MQKQFVIPMRCKNCGTAFDLWNDLVDNMEIDEKFCRNCRALTLAEFIESHEAEETIPFANTLLDEEDFNQT